MASYPVLLSLYLPNLSHVCFSRAPRLFPLSPDRRPDDWTLSWGSSGVIYVWGHNHRGQLGGLDGAKVKQPTPCEAFSLLKPAQLIGGEQTLFAVTSDGKVR